MWGTIIAGALGLAGQLYGGYTASQAMKRAHDRSLENLEERKRENQDWYDRRYNEDPTQRADAQRILNITAENIKRRNKAAAGTQAVMGGTEESVAGTKQANAEALADAVSRIAVAGEARKDRIEDEYRRTKQGILDSKTDLENNYDVSQAQNVSQAIAGAASAAGNLAGVFDGSGKDDDKKDK